MMSRLGAWVAWGLVATACNAWFENAGAADGEVGQGEAGMFPGAGLGEPCAAEEDCRRGLGCVGGACQAEGTAQLDESCLLTEECAPGLVCGWFGFCTAQGEGVAGDSCASASDCLRGHVCSQDGFAGFCSPAAAQGVDLGGACGEGAPCLAGLVCSGASATCVPGSLLLNPDVFQGVACPGEAGLPFGVRMHVPREGDGADFYSLPFPNDVRLKDGHPQLADHPRPGPGVVGFDPLGAILDHLQADTRGWSVEPGIFLRFTHPVDQASLTAGAAGASLRLVDLDSGAEVPFTFHFEAERNKYICENHLVVHPLWSQPLAEGHTYAVLVSSGVLDTEGRAAQALDDLGALLDVAAPAEAALQAAWEAYAPLRAFVQAQGLAASDLAGAAVFSVGQREGTLPALRAAVEAAEAPRFVDGTWFVCGVGAPADDPCDTPGWAATPKGQAGEPDPRACPAVPLAGAWEVHGKMRLPVWQEGTRPYRREGGAVLMLGGAPQVQGYEEVCVAAVFPKAGMPVNGWPVLLYAHGTGGSYRNGASELGGEVATRGGALIGWDQPMHGDRRGAEGTALDPGPLFYNFANPAAARGNLLQGAADLFALVRLARGLAVIVPGAGQLALDGKRMGFLGHSQGATTGPLALPWADEMKGAALTGAGGSLVYGLLGKKKPYDSSIGLRVALQEGSIDEFHPALHLIQAYFDDTDPLTWAPRLLAKPAGAPLHLLHIFAWDDSYTPWRTSAIFAAATGAAYFAQPGAQAPPDLGGLDPLTDLHLAQATLPASNNVTVPGGKVTAVSVADSLDDPADDGHFVAYRKEVEKARLLRYLQTLLTSGVPTVE
jgi:hypothetical protein